MKRAVLFDLDGTLLDTLDDLADSGNAVLAAHGFEPHKVEAYRTFIGDGMSKLVERIFPPGVVTDPGVLQQRLQEYKEAYQARWRNKSKVYEGIPELLAKLAERGVKTGVLTNKAHDFALKCVGEYFGEHPWDVVLGQREGVPRKPDAAGANDALEAMGVKAEEALFVGDSSVDMQTAVNAGIRAVGVSWGFRGREELIANGASVVIDAPGELMGEL
ncbi:MAG: HAD family hydrolase [Verrucomicrobia bacterium]|nr:HAD family hydrolase [Verrucomicrobiota bacterium]